MNLPDILTMELSRIIFLPEDKLDSFVDGLGLTHIQGSKSA